MKKVFGTLFVCCLFFSSSFAQKFGYVDTDYILNQMPEYREAQVEIKTLAKGWEEEIKKIYKELEGKEAELRAEEVLLTKEMRDERRDCSS